MTAVVQMDAGDVWIGLSTDETKWYCYAHSPPNSLKTGSEETCRTPSFMKIQVFWDTGLQLPVFQTSLLPSPPGQSSDISITITHATLHSGLESSVQMWEPLTNYLSCSKNTASKQASKQPFCHQHRTENFISQCSWLHRICSLAHRTVLYVRLQHGF
jgi:hypothetical protein